MVHLSAPGLIMSSVLPFLLVALSVSSVLAMPERERSAPPMFPPQDMSNMPDFLDMNGTVPEGPGDMTDSYCEMVTSQLPWSCVCSRCKASLGPKGDRGDRGLPGMPGSPGRRGLTGVRGRPGFSGRTGIKGEKGDEGVKGDTGEVGRMGAKGERGFKGDKGDHGPNGPQGEVGPQGTDGMCPDRCETIPGPPGPGGLPGAAGPRGPTGLNGPMGSPGLMGDTGEAGVPGVPGVAGVKGDQGLEGECNCEDGATGSAGEKGDQGEVGAEGAQGEQGPQGIQGDQGDLGPMGMMGVPGPCMPAIQSSFSAGLSTVFPVADYPVVFTNVINNPQSHYSPLNGIYTAPVAGTYVFSYHLSVRERILKVGLFHNYYPQVKSTETTDHGTASQQVVLHLNQGDGIWIQVKDSLTNGMYTSNEDSSTFSGFLLHPDSCDVSMTGRDGPTEASGPFEFESDKSNWDSEEP